MIGAVTRGYSEMNPGPHNSSNGVSPTQDAVTARVALASVLLASVISVSVGYLSGLVVARVGDGGGAGFVFIYVAFPTAALVSQLITMNRCLRGLCRGGHVLMALLSAAAALAIGMYASIFCGMGCAFLASLGSRALELLEHGSRALATIMLGLVVTAGVASGIGFVCTVVLRWLLPKRFWATRGNV